MRKDVSLIIIISLIISCSSVNKKDDNSTLLEKFSGETTVPRKANKITIGTFINKTKKNNLEKLFILKLKEKFSANGRLAVVSMDEDPDVQLTGIFNFYQIQPLSFDSSGNVNEKRLRILISIRFINLKNKKVILHERNIQSFRKFSETNPPIEFEEIAYDKVVAELSDRVFEKIMTGWYSKLLKDIEKGK